MNWLYYLLEANLYLAIFYGFYRLVLHRETFYQLNRYYLLSTSALAFLLPFLKIGYLDNLFNPVSYRVSYGIPFSGELLPVTDVAPTETTADTVLYYYLLIAGFFLIRLSVSIYRIIQLSLKAEKTRKGNFIQVNLRNSSTAFSFFNLLFINPDTAKQNIVLQHELVHIKQRHSLDILFFEAVLIFNWFNPFCWLIRQDIKLIHEYIADEGTVDQGLTKHDYALFLIQNSLGSFSPPLTSQMYNQSILKDRINMLNKTKSPGRTRFRLLYVLPIMGGMLCASTLAFTKDYRVIDLYAKMDVPAPATQAMESQQTPNQEPKPRKKKSYPVEEMYDSSTGGTRPVKLIIINGKISAAKNFHSVHGYDQVKELNSEEAVAKYGKRAAKGALEFTGKNAQIAIKFPPPLHDKKVPGPPAPPKPPLVSKSQNIKVPPPLITRMPQYVTSKDELNLGENPIFVNDGSIVSIPQGKKILNYTAKSVSIHPKNDNKLIDLYGESAKDGVIELTGGKITFGDL